MRIGRATGFQVVFLMFAVMLLAVPAADLIARVVRPAPPWSGLIQKGTQFAFAIGVILAFPGLRKLAAAELARPLPHEMRAEIALVALAKVSLAFASTAMLAIWLWLREGPAGVERLQVDVDWEQSLSQSDAGLVRLFLVVLVAPVVEELVCRGFIYRAFERQWGWIVSMLATSTVFGLYHPHFWSAFVSSVVFVCLLRRTGSLRAPILVHMLYNFMLWWPLLGQHVFPHGVPLSDVSTWRFHFLCLAFVTVALPIYVWMSRDRHVTPRTMILDPNAAVPK